MGDPKIMDVPVCIYTALILDLEQKSVLANTQPTQTTTVSNVLD